MPHLANGILSKMRKFLRLIDKFKRDEEGAFLALFGVMAIVVVAMSGAVIDFVYVEQARNRAQVAMDSAVLALQPTIYDVDFDVDDLANDARQIIAERINDTRISVAVNAADIIVNEADGTLYLKATIDVPMTFVALVGIQNMTASVVSQATRKKLFMEIAMVLDNSGSMAWSNRMTNLKAAAKNAADILFDYQDSQPNTYISVVPFNFWVNVGSSNWNESWMTGTATSGIALDNFDDDDDPDNTFAGPLNRFDLYNQMSNASWAGCVEARIEPYDADDTEPNGADPDTLFVPTFAPDEPSGYANNYLTDDNPAACPAPPELTRDCIDDVEITWNNNGWDYAHDYIATYPDATVVTGSNACSCENETILTDSGWAGGGGFYSATRTCVDHYFPERVLQERICKYNGNGSGSTTVNIGASYSLTGPNAGCVATPLLPLINDRSDVKDRIDAMTSWGYTNIHQGAIWGFHALSPTEPFTEGRDYDTATSKIMILMTDGENTYVKDSNMNGDSAFSPYGHLYNDGTTRLQGAAMSNTEGEIEDFVDARLLATCTNAKTAGIVIYTIGLAAPADVETMLTACATTPGNAHFPATPAELNSVFESIALELADLRLSL